MENIPTETAFKKGDYVLATKYGDGDPQDHWVVGFFKRNLDQYKGEERLDIVDNKDMSFRGNGFRWAKRITDNEGRKILGRAKEIESSWRCVHSFLRFLRGEFSTEDEARQFGGPHREDDED